MTVIRRPSDCLFCRQDDGRLNHITHQNKTCFARYDNYPAAEGHTEIVPKRHVESFFDLTTEELQDAFALIQVVRQDLRMLTKADGYTIGINEGRAAGRTIDHLHIHVIPRRFGDVADPRGGIRQVVPNFDPDLWASDPWTSSAWTPIESCAENARGRETAPAALR